MEPISVSALNQYVKRLLGTDPSLRNVMVKGEISNFVNHLKTGHFYFSLKDNTAAVKAVMFSANAKNVKFIPENGMSVIITGSVQVFERDGVYQLYAEDMQPDGFGALYLAYEQLKKQLEEKGLFDLSRKKPLPVYPKVIGIITSKTGAAIGDMVNILSRRYPIGKAVLYPVLVQGDQAPQSLVGAVRAADARGNIDVIIIGRGGGSIEDLWAFNSPELAQALYECKTPLISAVGHEMDYTICDFVCDLRAPTPSAAAELATPDLSKVAATVLEYRARLYNAQNMAFIQREQILLSLSHRLYTASPKGRLEQLQQKYEQLRTRIFNAAYQFLEQKSNGFSVLTGKLDSLSPLKTLSRGYGILYHEEKAVSSVKTLTQGDKIRIRLKDGLIDAEVTNKLEIEGGQQEREN